MVSRSFIEEAAELLPKMPDTDNLKEIKAFIQNNLHYNSQYSRQRYERYITVYLFPNGFVDKEIKVFSQKVSAASIKNVCLYRFSKKYPLIYDLFEDLFIPKISSGSLPRRKLDEYLQQRFPHNSLGMDGSRGFVEALTDAGVMKYKGGILKYNYREVDLNSFAFILHTEFPKSGMFDISLIEHNRVFFPQLWRRKDFLESLYRLRNRGILSKVSEIDTVRQFTTKYTLEEFVINL